MFVTYNMFVVGKDSLPAMWVMTAGVKDNGEWKWANGEPMEYTNWMTNQPNSTQTIHEYAMFAQVHKM